MQVELYAERVSNRGLSACSQAESLKFKLVQVSHLYRPFSTLFVPQRHALCCRSSHTFLLSLDQGLAVRRACYSVLRYIMENGAKGAQVIQTPLMLLLLLLLLLPPPSPLTSFRSLLRARSARSVPRP